MPPQRLAITVLSALLTLSFLMTWVRIDLGFFERKITGVALPGQLHALLNAGNAMNEAVTGQSSGVGLFALSFYVLYLIPLSAAALLFRAVTNRAGRLSIKVQAILTGALSLALAGLFGLLLSQLVGTDLAALLTGKGYGLTLLTALSLIIVPVFLKRDHPATLSLTPEQQERVRHQGQQAQHALFQAGGWMKAQQQQLSERLEEARLKQALGRRIDRDLLNSVDQVVAERGTVITHALIDRARQEGVLDLLLGSVDGTSAPSASKPS